MISGASPSAGKTFISSNLAATIAITGKKVLFIDADLRKGYAHKMFGHKNDKGLSEFLSGQAAAEMVIDKVEGGNLITLVVDKFLQTQLNYLCIRVLNNY